MNIESWRLSYAGDLLYKPTIKTALRTELQQNFSYCCQPLVTEAGPEEDA